MPIFTFSVKNLIQSKVYLTQLTFHILPFFTIFTGKKSGVFTEKYFTGKFTLVILVIADDVFDVGNVPFERSPQAAISRGAAAGASVAIV